MENNKKKIAIDVDQNYDLMMVRRLPASLRWALMLPLAFLGMTIVHLAYGAFMPRLLTGMHDEGGVSIVLSSLFIWYKYYVFVVAMVGTAPVQRGKKLAFSWVAVAIAMCLCAGTTSITCINADEINTTMMAATAAASVLGALWAVWKVRKVTSKPLDAEQEQDATQA